MAKKKDKAGAQAPAEDNGAETEAGGEAQPESEKKRGFGAILARLNPLAILKLPLKQKIMVGGGVLVVLLAVGGAAVFLAGGKKADEAKVAENKPAGVALPNAQASFYDVPDIIVNIQTADGTAAYLKLTVSLEVDQPEAKTQIDPILPRITDQFQTYLRELRVEDIRGSAGVMRLKEELLRRVNLAAAPLVIHDVLLKEMIVQ